MGLLYSFYGRFVMGEAKRRGTFEQRKAQAIERGWQTKLAQREKRRVSNTTIMSPQAAAILAMAGYGMASPVDNKRDESVLLENPND
jgi:hypothetical protein